MNSIIKSSSELAITTINVRGHNIHLLVGCYNLHIGTEKCFLDGTYGKIFESIMDKRNKKCFTFFITKEEFNITIVVEYIKNQGLYYMDGSKKLLLLTEPEFKLYLRKSKK